MLLLFRRRDKVVAQGLLGGLGVRAIAERLDSGLRSAIVEVRSVARASGIARVKEEAASAGVAIGEAESKLTAALVTDTIRGRRFAGSYAKRWFRKAYEADVETIREAASVASSGTAGSLKRIAVTESSEAFTKERTETLAARGHSLGLLKVWDSTLDRNTCVVCEDADGTIVSYNENFPTGTPGGVHAFCRCGWTLLRSDEVDDGTLISPTQLKPVA